MIANPFHQIQAASLAITRGCPASMCRTRYLTLPCSRESSNQHVGGWSFRWGCGLLETRIRTGFSFCRELGLVIIISTPGLDFAEPVGFFRVAYMGVNGAKNRSRYQAGLKAKTQRTKPKASRSESGWHDGVWSAFFQLSNCGLEAAAKRSRYTDRPKTPQDRCSIRLQLCNNFRH